MTASTIPDAEVPAALAAAYPELRKPCKKYHQSRQPDYGLATNITHEQAGCPGYLPLTGLGAVSAMLALLAGMGGVFVGANPFRAMNSRTGYGTGSTLELALGRALLAAKGGA